MDHETTLATREACSHGTEQWPRVWWSWEAGGMARAHARQLAYGAEVLLDVANPRDVVLGGAAAVRRAGLPTLHDWFV